MSIKAENKLRYIDTQAELQEFCAKLKALSYITIDTEFVREQTYYPKLCLIQIATDREIACIDPLAIDDLSPLSDILQCTDLLKVFHAARQDIEAFYHLFNECPQPVFDTQIAASLLGHPDQVGYANLVEKILGVQLDKKHTRTDWSKRPLSDAQLKYAADDVRYLRDIYPVIMEKLEQTGRQDWLKADFEFLTSKETYTLDMGNLWKKVSGHQKLKRKQLTVLNELAKWREHTAQKADKPRKWILSDDALVTLAIHTPESEGDINNIRLGKQGLSDKNKNRILKVIQQALSIPEENWISLPKFTKLTTKQSCLVDAMICIARDACNKNNVAMASVTTRKELEKYIVQPDSKPTVMKGWRYQIAGKELERFLNGITTIKVDNGNLIIENVNNN